MIASRAATGLSFVLSSQPYVSGTGLVKASRPLPLPQTRSTSCKGLQSGRGHGLGTTGRRVAMRMSRTETCGKCSWANLRGGTNKGCLSGSGESRESGTRLRTQLRRRPLRRTKCLKSGRMCPAFAFDKVLESSLMEMTDNLF